MRSCRGNRQSAPRWRSTWQAASGLLGGWKTPPSPATRGHWNLASALALAKFGMEEERVTARVRRRHTTGALSKGFSRGPPQGVCTPGPRADQPVPPTPSHRRAHGRRQKQDYVRAPRGRIYARAVGRDAARACACPLPTARGPYVVYVIADRRGGFAVGLPSVARRATHKGRPSPCGPTARRGCPVAAPPHGARHTPARQNAIGRMPPLGGMMNGPCVKSCQPHAITSGKGALRGR